MKNNLVLLLMSCFSIFLIGSCGGEDEFQGNERDRNEWFAKCREIREKMDECILSIQDPNDQAAGKACTDEYKNNEDKLHREQGRDPDNQVVEGCPIP